MTDEPAICDVCAVEAGPGTRIVRFELVHRGHPAGGISLCQRCWRGVGNRPDVRLPEPHMVTGPHETRPESV